MYNVLKCTCTPIVLLIYFALMNVLTNNMRYIYIYLYNIRYTNTKLPSTLKIFFNTTICLQNI